MDGKKWLDRWIGPVRETLEKLSRPQRLSLGILGASLLVALGMLITSGGPSEDMVLYPTASAEEQVPFTSWLDSQGIAYEVAAKGVRIPRSEIDFINLQARMLKAEGKTEDHFRWVDQAASFQESHRARSDRWSVSLKRSLEDALSRSNGIRTASVNFTPSRKRNSILARDIGAQAAVQLAVDRAVYQNGLPPSKARAAGSFVAGALGLNLQNVTVTDENLTEFDLSASAVLSGGDTDHEARYTAKITDFLEQSFAVDAFSVLVFVRQSLRTSEEHVTSVDPENTVSLVSREEKEKARNNMGAVAPGVKPNVAKLGEGDTANASMSDEYERTSRDNTVDYGRKETRTEVPPGEIEEISISLSLDLQAVVDAIQREYRILNPEAGEDAGPKGDALKAEIDQFRSRWEQNLVSATSLPAARVKTNVDIASRAPIDTTAMFGDGQGGVLTWAKGNAVSLVLLLVTLCGGFFLLRAARTGIPEVEEFPDPVAEIEEFLKKREERIAEEAAAAEAELEAQEEDAVDRWAITDEDQVTLDLLEDVTRFSQEHRETAALVIRQWLKEGPITSRSGIR